MNPYTKVSTTLASIQYHSIFISTHLYKRKGLRNKVCQFRIIFYVDTYCSNSVYIFRARNGFSRIVVHLTIANVFFHLFVLLSFSSKGLANESGKKISQNAALILCEPFKLIKNFNGLSSSLKYLFAFEEKCSLLSIHNLRNKSIHYTMLYIHRCQTKEITTNLQYPRVRTVFFFC